VAKTGAEFRISQQLAQPVGQHPGTMGRHKQAGDTILDVFGRGAHGSGTHCKSRRHPFENRIAEALHQGGVHHHLALRNNLAPIIKFPEKLYPSLKLKLGGQNLQMPPPRAIADNRA
jgi:hypothetical protein